MDTQSGHEKDLQTRSHSFHQTQSPRSIMERGLFLRAAVFGLHEATALADDMAGRQIKAAQADIGLVEIFLHLALRTPQSAGTHPLPHVVEEHVVQGRTRIPEVGER